MTDTKPNQNTAKRDMGAASALYCICILYMFRAVLPYWNFNTFLCDGSYQTRGPFHLAVCSLYKFDEIIDLL